MKAVASSRINVAPSHVLVASSHMYVCLFVNLLHVFSVGWFD